MVSKVNKDVAIGEVRVDDGFNQFTAELYVPSSASKSKEPLKFRQFIFIDGEGVKRDDEHDETIEPKCYALVGASTGERLIGLQLSTVQLFSFLIELRVRHPNALFVGFALNYDVNMMCKDIPVSMLKNRIRKAKRTRWRNYTVMYMPGKRFQITDRIRGVTFSVSDVFSFFQCAFVSKDGETPGACEEYLGWDDPRLIKIREGKAQRSDFLWSELKTFVEPYMTLELELGVELVERLRHYLLVADIRPRGWHGPGAIASALMAREGIRNVMKKPEPAVETASRLSYFGGRFEQMFTGYYDGEVYQYDIRSAYPYALTHCPDLTSGSWHYRKEPTDNGSQFKMYELRYHNNSVSRTNWHPLPLRSTRSTIHYQGWVHGMYWAPEAEIAIQAFPNEIEIMGVLEYDDNGDRPLDFIREMYDQRALWKKEGNPAELANKLGMNSFYGKFAQRVGWNDKTMESPPSHQLEWAGFTTSFCRGMMLQLMLQDPESVIALETDGLFSMRPLVVDEGKALGQYEVDVWDGIIYIQNGVYFKRENHIWRTGKTRGFGKNTLPVSDALNHAIDLEPMTTYQNRFVGMAYADSPRWRKFLPHEHVVQWGGNGKRVHRAKHCTACENGETWHRTVWQPGGYSSHPHVLPWRDGRTTMFQDEADHEEEFQI